jgi:hypothetical protein
VFEVGQFLELGEEKLDLLSALVLLGPLELALELAEAPGLFHCGWVGEGKM